ncbi:MAG: MATE family efflux transporter, partial [Oscillospiraceae bacterium]|nr:MATE family efflux transporter [Oscillospiraceae bacterium]
SFSRQALASVASIFLNWAARPYGDAAIAAMGIVNKVSMFSGSAVIGFGQGFQPVCGFNFGAGLYRRVREAYWFCVKLGTGVLAAVAVIVFAFAGQIVHAFQPGDAEVVALGTLALRWAMAALPTMAYSTTNNMMLQTVGETGRATLLSAARQGLFFIPAILILPWLFEFNGVMVAQPVADVGACLLAIPLSTGFLNKMRRMEQEKDLQN